MVDSMAPDDLLCKLEMDDLIYMNIYEEHPSKPVCNNEDLGTFLYEIFP